MHVRVRGALGGGACYGHVAVPFVVPVVVVVVVVDDDDDDDDDDEEEEQEEDVVGAFLL